MSASVLLETGRVTLQVLLMHSVRAHRVRTSGSRERRPVFDSNRVGPCMNSDHRLKRTYKAETPILVHDELVHDESSSQNSRCPGQHALKNQNQVHARISSHVYARQLSSLKTSFNPEAH